MKTFVVVLALIASANCGVRKMRQGWNSPPPPTQGWTTVPPTTTGWPATAPPTTGWPATAPPTTGWPATAPPTQGWNQPAAPGWGAAQSVLTNIDLNAALAAAGSGWAAENHSENVAALGAGGWGGPNAEITISAGGESVVAQEGDILQVTSQDSENASSLNNISVNQIASGSEGEIVDALGLEVSNAQSGWAAATGDGASAADGTSSITVNNVAASLGLARP